jgi:glutamine amidotransferase-like uncharacterized protein
MKKIIAIYNDAGTSQTCIKSLEALLGHHEIIKVNAEDIMSGAAFENLYALIMPGGADLPYCEKLTEPALQNIRDYIENGGNYIGICAGAYFACTAIEYNKGQTDEICGPRALGLVNAIAYGSHPQLAPYYDDTINTASVVNLIDQFGVPTHSFYHGGPAFALNDPDVRVVTQYAEIDNVPPAVITKQIGAGNVLLVGVHPEMTESAIASYDVANENEQKIKDDLIAQFKELRDNVPNPLFGWAYQAWIDL